MSNWLSKDLTLDLLAIGIHSLNKIHQRIAQGPEEGQSEKPPAAEALPAAEPELKPAEPELKPAAEDPAPQKPQPEPEEPPAAADEEPDPAVRAEAQTALRTITQTEGNDGITWITGTLFPHFGVASLTDVPDGKLEELITMAKAHTDERSAA